jgi:hypothetical protein
MLAFGPSIATGLADLAVMGSAVWATQNAAHIPKAEGDYSPWSPDPEVNKQYVRYKARVDETKGKLPPYNNPKKPKCEEIDERIKLIQEQIDARLHLNNTWFGGVFNKGHADIVSNLKKDRDRLKRRLDRGDCECP